MKKIFFSFLAAVVLSAACGPPSKGKSPENAPHPTTPGGGGGNGSGTGEGGESLDLTASIHADAQTLGCDGTDVTIPRFANVPTSLAIVEIAGANQAALRDLPTPNVQELFRKCIRPQLRAWQVSREGGG